MRALGIFLSIGLVMAGGGCAKRTMPAEMRMEPVNRSAVIAAAAARGMVRVNYYDPEIAVFLPYATTENVFGRALYPPGFPALLSHPTALKLAIANGKLRPHGLQLLVLDAYRPPEVQWQIFQLHRSDRYVSDPRKRWSKHTYGRAVDVTLMDARGRALRMPSAFDDFSEKAAAAYTGSDPEIRANVTRLQEAMTAAGFTVYADEWWHFNDLSDPYTLSRPPIFGRDLGLPVKTDPARP
jgi:D-alanyl-D-alanine dipeptidase